MTLYHGSFLEVAKPDLVHSRPNVDFGRGFYVTPLYEQAAKWCGKFIRRGKDGIVSRYEHAQELLPSVIAMKEKGYTYRQIADQIGMEKEQIEELCSRERRKQRKIEKGYIPQPKGRPRKTPATQEQLQNNQIVDLEMKVELLQNFLSECGRM